MVRLVDKSMISFLDYFFMFSIIIYAGAASAFVRGLGDIRTFGNGVALALTFLFAVKHDIKFDKSFITVVLVFTVYSICAIVSTGSSEYFLRTYSQWIIIFFIAYVACKGYGYKFFVVAETVLCHLCVIAIFFWVILLIIPTQFTNFIDSIALPWYTDLEHSANIILYTVNIYIIGGESSDFYSIARNAGFAWEPGGFACFICFGICFNALRTNLKLKMNLPLWVFFVALASTQSTTGYGTFMVMLVVLLIVNKKIGWLIVLVPIGLMVMNLPFMAEKLQLRSEGFSDATLDYAATGEAFDRLLSFKILWDEFLRHPLFGYGYSEPEFLRLELDTWSGIGRLLAQFGIIMSCLFFYLLIRSSLKLNSVFGNRSGIMIVIAMIGMMVSYMSWAQPFCVAIWMSYLFISSSQMATRVSINPKIHSDDKSLHRMRLRAEQESKRIV